MQNIIEICKEFGIEIPADKHADLLKRVHDEGYITKAEHEKKLGKVETERDKWKQQAETAEETLKGFEGIDPEQIKQDIADYKQRAEDAEKDYAAKLYQRDFEDALKAEMEGYKFTSAAAKKAVMAEIAEAGLKLKDGKILGLSDLVEQIRAGDASAFVDEHQQQLEQNKAKFTTAMNKGGGAPGGAKVSPAELMRMKNENPDLDIRQYM